MDTANIVDPDARAALENALRALNEQTGTQITVFTFSSLENQAIEEIGIKAADRWKLGAKGKTGSSDKSLDRGVILLIAVQEHKMRIEVGRGLEGTLTDLNAKRIIDLKIAPYFKAGRMSDGILVGVSEIANVTDPDVDLSAYFNGRRAARSIGGNTPMPFSLIIFLIFIFVFGVIRIGGGGGFGGWGGGGFGGFSGGGGGGGWGGGGGGFNGGGASGDW